MMICGTHADDVGRNIADFYGQVVGRTQTPPYAAMAWLKADQRYETAAIFHDYNGANIEVHFVGRLTRRAIRETLRYAFVQLGVLRITAKPFAMRDDLVNPLRKMGFEVEGLMKDYYGLRGDALVLRLSPDAAKKWMN